MTGFNRGDTIIEVLIAVTIFSIVAVGGVSLMNQGAATAQRSLEITLVRQEIDAQAEALRMLNANYVSAYVSGEAISSYDDISQQWIGISNTKTVASVQSFGLGSNTNCSQIIPKDSGFIINTRTLKSVYLSDISSSDHSQTYSKVNYNELTPDLIDSVDGLWIEAIKGQENASAKTSYIDFHIRACWDSIGQTLPITIGTIVRLYEPRG